MDAAPLTRTDFAPSLADAVGLIGVSLIVGTYFLSQIGRMSVDRVAYPAANALGAALILVSLWFSFNFASFVIEIFWLAISLVGLARTLRKRRGRPETESPPKN